MTASLEDYSSDPKVDQMRRINKAASVLKESVSFFRDELIVLIAQFGSHIDLELDSIETFFKLESEMLRAPFEVLLGVNTEQSMSVRTADLNQGCDFDPEKVKRIVKFSNLARQLNESIDLIRDALVRLAMGNSLTDETLEVVEAYFKQEADHFREPTDRLRSLKRLN